MKKFLIWATAVALSLTAVSCGENSKNAPADEPLHTQKPAETFGKEIAKKANGTIRIMSYNVGVFNKYLKDGYQEVANIIKEADADVMLFQELDSCATRTGGVYQLKQICSLLGKEWDYHYGAGLLKFQGGKYGVGIAADKAAKAKAAKNLNNYNDGERRGLAVLEFDNYVIGSTHLGLKDEAQINQLKEITDFMKEKYGNSNKPILLGGDLNAASDFALIPELKKDWKILSTTSTATYSTEQDKYCIDYILVLNNSAASKVEVVNSKVVREAKSANVKTASDHYPVYVDVKIK